VIVEPALVGPDQVLSDREVLVHRREEVGVLGHDEVAAGGDRRVLGERVFDAVGEGPAGQGDGVGAAVVQFDVLVSLVPRGVVVHDLVDHDVVDQFGGVGRAERAGREAIERIGPVGIPAERRLRVQGLVSQGVQDADGRGRRGVGGRGDVDRLARRIQGEGEAVGRCPLSHGPEPARLQRRADGDLVLQKVRAVVAEVDVAQTDRDGAGIVQLDPVAAVAGVAVGQDFVDDDAGPRVLAGVGLRDGPPQRDAAEAVGTAGQGRIVDLERQNVLALPEQVHERGQVHRRGRRLRSGPAAGVVGRRRPDDAAGIPDADAVEIEHVPVIVADLGLQLRERRDLRGRERESQPSIDRDVVARHVGQDGADVLELVGGVAVAVAVGAVEPGGGRRGVVEADLRPGRGRFAVGARRGLLPALEVPAL